ncbi:glycosyltransferase family 2 protein [Salinimonas lutimaris]|uniref:glycosyltransferase family 2 protein n=1 Tax=Salinimonas lutimaris TaxID=914153 RepID=UPI001586B177|nr:glycosyltransferase [Salinimonas lutimaris]
MDPQFSIVTIVKERSRQLASLVQSLEKTRLRPQELIVVWMTSPCDESLISSEAFSVQHRFLANESVPVPRARNKGMAACSTEQIIYLDVDCLCPPDLFESVLTELHDGQVVSTQVRFLPSPAQTQDYATARQHAVSAPDAVELLHNQPVAWSYFHTLLFAITKADFIRTGGFDESYHGVGVGDIDFAARCDELGFALVMLKNDVLHQFYPGVEPPVQQLFDIVNNATRYKQKWGEYPLQGWLQQFAQSGLINDDYETEGLRVKRLPTDEEIQAQMAPE